METPTQYNFYDDAYQQLQSNKPVRDVESEDVARKRAKLNAIAEGLRTIAEIAGNFGANAPVEKRGPNQEVLRATQDYNNTLAKYNAEDRAWKNSMYQFKLGDAQRKERNKLAGDQIAAADKRAKDKLIADAAEHQKNRDNDINVAKIRNEGKGKEDKEDEMEKDIQFNYFENNQPKLGKAKVRELKSVGSRILNQYTYDELRKVYPGIADKIDKLQYDAKAVSDKDLVTLGQTFWSDFKEGFYPSEKKETPTQNNLNWFNQPKDDVQIPLRPKGEEGDTDYEGSTKIAIEEWNKSPKSKEDRTALVMKLKKLFPQYEINDIVKYLVDNNIVQK